MEVGYVVVAFVYFTAGGGTTISTLPGADEYKVHVTKIDCEKSKKEVLKKRKDVFNAQCLKVPTSGDVQPALPSTPGESAGGSEDRWTIIVDAVVSAPWFGFGTPVRQVVPYPQDTELTCRKMAELLERYGDKRHGYKCDTKQVVKR